MNDVIPEDYKKIDASASLIAKEQFNITKFKFKYFLKHPSENEIYMIAFGDGPKTESNPKGFYCFWNWYYKTPYGGLINCTLKNRFDSIDYFQACVQNAEATITQVLNPKTDESIAH